MTTESTKYDNGLMWMMMPWILQVYTLSINGS